MTDYKGDPRQSAEFKYEQTQAPYRKALKRLIESGVPRSLARGVARDLTRKPRQDK